MKKIILTAKQAKYLTEENAVNISAQSKDNTTSGFINAATNPNTISDINKASVATSDVNLVISGPESNDNQPQQVVNVTNGDSVQTAMTNQTNDELIRNGGSVVVKGDGFVSETKIFTKKTIEEAKLKKLRENSIVYTKKELSERIKK
jgi:hypothetical protein